MPLICVYSEKANEPKKINQYYASAEELSKAVGFNVPEIKSLPFKVSETEYMTLGEGFTQITYLSDDDRLIYRNSTDKEDNSGNYSPYDYVGEVSVNDIKVTVKEPRMH